MKIQNFYHSKWFPRIFYKKPDGGRDSGVTAFFLIEWKPVLSIGLLRFNTGSRETFHNHAFNAVTWWLSGHVREERPNYNALYGAWCDEAEFIPSIKPKYTSRKNLHRVFAYEKTWALTFRGPWRDFWQEWRLGESEEWVTLTHGRKIV